MSDSTTKSSAPGWALITGGTHGIGEELAKCAGRDGFNLVIVGRDQDKLSKIAATWPDEFSAQNKTKIQIIGISIDLNDPSSAQQIYDQVTSKHIQIDLLMNNAGQAVFGHFANETKIEDEIQLIQVNVLSFMQITKLFLRDMVARKQGRILHTSSLAAETPIPKQAVYSGTKGFIAVWSIALQNELQDTGVSLSILYPGTTDTEIFERMGAENTKLYNETPVCDPKDVAKDGYNGVMSGQAKIVSGILTKLLLLGSKVLPDSVVSGLMRHEMKEKEELGKTTKD